MNCLLFFSQLALLLMVNFGRHHVYHHQSVDGCTYRVLDTVYPDQEQYHLHNSSLCEFGESSNKSHPFRAGNKAQSITDRLCCRCPRIWDRLLVYEPQLLDVLGGTVRRLRWHCTASVRHFHQQWRKQVDLPVWTRGAAATRVGRCREWKKYRVSAFVRMLAAFLLGTISKFFHSQVVPQVITLIQTIAYGSQSQIVAVAEGTIRKLLNKYLVSSSSAHGDYRINIKLSLSQMVPLAISSIRNWCYSQIFP